MFKNINYVRYYRFKQRWHKCNWYMENNLMSVSHQSGRNVKPFWNIHRIIWIKLQQFVIYGLCLIVTYWKKWKAKKLLTDEEQLFPYRGRSGFTYFPPKPVNYAIKNDGYVRKNIIILSTAPHAQKKHVHSVK